MIQKDTSWSGRSLECQKFRDTMMVAEPKSIGAGKFLPSVSSGGKGERGRVVLKTVFLIVDCVDCGMSPSLRFYHAERGWRHDCAEVRFV